MKKKTLIIIVAVIAVIALTVAVIYFVTSKNSKENADEIKTDISDFEVIDESNNASNNEVTVESLKQELGAEADSSMYEVTDDGDGRKVLAIKPSLEYSVAMAGILNNQKKFDKNEVESIMKNAPEKNGIWISENARKKFTKIINQFTNSEYYVDNNGYLQEQKVKNNKYTKLINNLINGNKLYSIDINDKCYVLDEMTGEIQENPFEEMDPYQTYEYFENNEKMAIILSTNKAGVLTNNEIIESFLELCNN